MTDRAISLSRPDITDAEVRAVLEVLRTDRLSIGPRQEEFEAAVAARAGRRYGVAVNSGTSALHLCVCALGIGPGDEVITTPFTFIATVNCLLMAGARPVLVDVDPDSYNMDPRAAEAAVTPATRALLPVEVFGNMACFAEYERIARAHGLRMIEDSCEALGGVSGGRAAGSFGDCSAFAFYPNKQVTTGEGGMIVTDDRELRDLCVSMRNQGRDSGDWFSHARLGYNYRLSELNAALGLAQMRRLDDILARRRQVAQRYNQALADVDEIHLPPMSEPEGASWFVYVVRLKDRFTRADRDRVLARLRSEGVGCAAYFPPVHLQRHVRQALGAGPGSFPAAERLAERTIALPFHTNLTDEDADTVKKKLCQALDEL